MSGGSYNYLCSRQPDELLDRREDIESARDELVSLGAPDVGQVLTDILTLASDYRAAVESKMASVYTVLHELEWWQSNDHVEEDFRAALAEYRAAQAKEGVLSVPNSKTVYTLDTEFIEDGRTIDLISIGIVCEDGREYYAVNADMPIKRIRKHQWLMDNVVPGLPKPHGDWINHMPSKWLFDYRNPVVKDRKRIASEVRDFLLAAGEPELWANYSAYDHVVLAQLWGPMSDLPQGIPMWTHDIQQAIERSDGCVFPVQETGVHNALEDTRHNMRMLNVLGIV